jgi:glycosyltransferase involved in cell wall biosynthesis
LIGDNTKENISIIHLAILKYLSNKTYQIAVAEHVFNEYFKKTGYTNNLRLIKNTIPFPFTKKLEKFNTIGFIGRFTKEKGFSSLPDISVKLKEKYPELKIVIMGDEPKSIGEFLINHNGNVELQNPDFKIESFYQKIDLVLFLSTAPEGAPLVVLEALTFDVGIIAFPLKGVKEILGDDYPLLVNSNEEIIEKLILYYSDKIKLDELNQIHKRISDSYNYKDMLTQIKKLYS